MSSPHTPLFLLKPLKDYGYFMFVILGGVMTKFTYEIEGSLVTERS